MTRNEKMNFALSASAIMISILTPVGAYYWLDPTIQALRHRRPLLVDQHSRDLYGIHTYWVTILNAGPVPASDVLVVIRCAALDVPNPPAPAPEIEPPAPSTFETQGGVSILRIGRALGAGESIAVRIPDLRTPDGKTHRTYFETRVYSDVGLAIHRNHAGPPLGGGQSGGGGGGG